MRFHHPFWRVASSLCLGWIVACGTQEAPATPPAIAELGRLQPEVREDLERATAAVTERPDSAQRWGQLGLRYEANGLPKAAWKCFQEAHRLEPKEPRWPYRAGVVAKRAGDLEGAITWLQTSLAIDDTYPTSYQRMADSQLQLGQFEQAKSNFQAVLGLDPNRPEARAGLAKVHLQEERLDEALDAIQKARALDGESPYWQLVHGTVLAQLGQEEEALPLLQAGQGSKPNIHDPWSQKAQSTRSKQEDLLQRGMDLEAEGDFSGAVRAYRELITLRPGEARLPLRLARTLLKAGRLEEALQVAEATLDAFPTHLELMVLRGALLHKLGRMQAAWDSASQALQHHPDRPDGHLFLTSLHAATGNWEAARHSAQTALDLAPSDVRSRETLGKVLLRMGQTQAAAECLEGPIYAVGFHAPLGYFHLLGQCLETLGETSRLQTMVKRARELHGDHVFRGQ